MTNNSEINDDYKITYDSFIFFFERKFFNPKFVNERRRWINENWYYSIVIAFIYISCVHGCQYLMRNREKFHLYRSLVAWNFIMAGFSILGTVRFVPYFWRTLTEKGLVYSVCGLEDNIDEYYAAFGVAVCWTILYRTTKSFELVDTAFIVLRKQRLIFLHWYHHAITMIYTWYSVRDSVAYGRWFIAMNYTVHAIMYSYYAFRAMRYRIPKSVSIAITSLQLLQMVFGIFVNLVAAYQLNYGDTHCNVPRKNIYFSFLLYFSFFLLFANYFRTNYLMREKKTTAKSGELRKKTD